MFLDPAVVTPCPSTDVSGNAFVNAPFVSLREDHNGINCLSNELALAGIVSGVSIEAFSLDIILR